MTDASRRDPHSRRLSVHFRRIAGRILFVALMVAIGVFFALPLVWLFVAPFDANPTMAVRWPDWTLGSFQRLADNPYALRSILNSLIIAGGTMAVTVAFGTLASYALSRVRIPGRDALLYGLLLLSSIVTGTAAMVPTFQLMNAIGLIDTQAGVMLVLAGGLLPTVVFILKDFMDSVPRSYEESARLYGAKPHQVLRDVVIPVARPGISFVAIWTVVQVWGNFLVPYLLLREPTSQPAAVLMYTFYTESGQADLRLISAFCLVFALPVILIYFFVNRRFGFRFYGGIKS
ncbi:MAG: carbohydrate ABC transporter permease [Actinomyces sp.]|jgi:multiple sugar transport system permease protein|nr:carbohydrate ABC transporter permease [Actinomyces sp.]MCI1642298.1 carbohydrate ABC transporter permease [Actinomyces sp.]MCI1662770.1 carbohydrate ABC transporter permease [Actinomyces sp.]MCI1691373.1 carbohydrate ABC transporter permease [Actinomyces sp.]MCI1788157.1 carbohydrate ABC transporter permease [Actinomyces sp.]MCI1830304.1 carbohydrate ABC transporter permease [Actinomyces sp.]